MLFFLDHGSFGACPRAVQAAQQHLRDLAEQQLVRYYVDHYPQFLAHVTREIAKFLHADAKDIVWVNNATSGSFCQPFPPHIR